MNKVIINFYKFTVLVLIAMCFVACAARKPSYSGFLGDESIYSALRDHPSLEGVKVFRVNDKPLANYYMFIIPPAKVYLTPQGRKRGHTSAELAELAQYFRNEVHEALSPKYSITNTPGPGVAIIRLAITDADPSISLTQADSKANLDGGGLGGASVEAELIDSVSGERIVAAVASSAGKRQNFASDLTKWGHTKGVLSEWAEILRKRVDEDHGEIG